MSKTRAWIMASRPATLTAAFVPVAVGASVAFAAQGFRLAPVLAALFGAIAIQIGTNFANDVFDFKKGADTAERMGPTRAVEAGLLSERAVLIGMCIAFVIASLFGVYLIFEAGLPILIIGVLSILSGIAYTGGPYPLAYLGLGDVFVFVFFGLVAVCGTSYVQMGQVPLLAWWAAIPIGCLATAILVVNNKRDRHTDIKANKKTLAVRFGRRFVEIEYILLMFVAYLVPVLLLELEVANSLWTLLPLISLPYAVRIIRDVLRFEGAPLNNSLAQTAKLLLIFGLLWATGMSLPHIT